MCIHTDVARAVRKAVAWRANVLRKALVSSSHLYLIAIAFAATDVRRLRCAWVNRLNVAGRDTLPALNNQAGAAAGKTSSGRVVLVLRAARILLRQYILRRCLDLRLRRLWRVKRHVCMVWRAADQSPKRSRQNHQQSHDSPFEFASDTQIESNP
jgi:hypothetical protein